MIPSFATPCYSDSICDEDLHAETVDPARSYDVQCFVLQVIDFHQRLQVTQSSFMGLGALRGTSVHGLQIHACFALRRSN